MLFPFPLVPYAVSHYSQAGTRVPAPLPTLSRMPSSLVRRPKDAPDLRIEIRRASKYAMNGKGIHGREMAALRFLNWNSNFKVYSY